jgi:hypothetical protein
VPGYAAELFEKWIESIREANKKVTKEEYKKE